jgi:hypothetical protein
MPDVKPISGPSTPEAIDQAHMVVEAVRELPNDETFDARGGGKIYTCEFGGSEETRPQEMHGSVNYQKITSSDGKPNFVAYTELTSPRKEIRG